MLLINKIPALITFLGICFLTMGLYADPCPLEKFADFCGAAGGEVGGEYIVTIKKIEISTDGVNFITLGESGGTPFNIASMNVGSDFQAFVTNTSVPAGVYNYLRITMSRTMRFKGVGQNEGIYYYTSQATGTSKELPYFPIAASCGTWNGDQPGKGCPSYDAVVIDTSSDSSEHAPPGETIEFVNNNQDMRVTRDISSSPIIITEDQKTIRIKFKTQGMIGFEVGPPPVIFPMPPVQEVEH